MRLESITRSRSRRTARQLSLFAPDYRFSFTTCLTPCKNGSGSSTGRGSRAVRHRTGRPPPGHPCVRNRVDSLAGQRPNTRVAPRIEPRRDQHRLRRWVSHTDPGGCPPISSESIPNRSADGAFDTGEYGIHSTTVGVDYLSSRCRVSPPEGPKEHALSVFDPYSRYVGTNRSRDAQARH